MQLRSLILPIAIIISLMLYYPTRDYGLVTDYLGWLNKYRAGNWSDIWTCFGYQGLHQFFHLINFLIYKITGANVIYLYLIFAITHGVTAYLVYRSLRYLSEWFSFQTGSLAAFFAAVFFLFSPYSAEVVTWKACFHYMMITCLALLSLMYFIRYLRFNHKRDLLIHLSLFIAGLFTLELGLVVPGIMGISYLGYYWQYRDKYILKKGILISGIHMIGLVIYFLLTKLSIGSYIGHYGAEKHMNFDPLVIGSGAAKYIVKYISFSHYFDFATRYNLYAFMDRLGGVLMVIVPLIILVIYFVSRKDMSAKFLVMCLVLFIIGLLPVLNLYFMNVNPYENDRYGYYASPWFYFFIVLLIFRGFPRIKYGLCLSYLGVLIYFVMHQIGDIRQASQVMHGLLKDFPTNEENLVLVSNPENYNGVYMFRDFSDDGVAVIESLDWLYGVSYRGTVKVMSNYNVKNLEPHLTAKFVGAGALEVWNIMSGSWFWRKGVGLQSYEKSGLKVDLKEGFFYGYAPQMPANTKYLCPNGMKWEVVENE